LDVRWAAIEIMVWLISYKDLITSVKKLNTLCATELNAKKIIKFCEVAAEPSRLHGSEGWT
jgi:hypothetical protein